MLLAGTFALPLPAFAADAQEATDQPATTETQETEFESRRDTWTPEPFTGSKDHDYKGYPNDYPDEFFHGAGLYNPDVDEDYTGDWNEGFLEYGTVRAIASPYSSWAPESELGQAVDPTGKVASNYQAQDGDVVIGTTSMGDLPCDDYDVRVYMAADGTYLGKTITAYVQYNDGTTAVKTSAVYNGEFESNIGTFLFDKPAALVTFVFRNSFTSVQMADSLKSDTSTVSLWTTDQTTGSITSLTALPEGEMPSNYKPASGLVQLAAFRLKGDARNFELKFNVDAKYAGMTAKLFFEHEDGATDVKTAKVAADGTVSFGMDRLSDYVLAVDTNSSPIGVGAVTGDDEPVAKKDDSAKSPQTGVDVAALQAMTGLAALAAAGCALYAISKVRSR